VFKASLGYIARLSGKKVFLPWIKFSALERKEKEGMKEERK
jgi:hypothetical protein